MHLEKSLSRSLSPARSHFLKSNNSKNRNEIELNWNLSNNNNNNYKANKPEAERARDLGAAALRSGELNRAIKLLTKSVQLYPLPGVEALLAQAKNQLEQSTTTNSNNNNSSNNDTDRRSSSANNNGSASASAAAGGGSGSSGGTDAKSGRSYTADQVQMVKDILKSKEGGRGAHYRILGLEQNATEAQIKKAYRKLALKLHPDKNSAPHADEAFKAVGLAYATLSDPQKRSIYDRYGEEDPDQRGGGGAAANMARHFRHGRGGGAQEVNPEDIFNMFFGGGMPGGGGMHRGPGGFHVYTNGFGFGGGGMPQGFRGQRQGPGQQRQQQQAQGGFGQLVQLLPLILIMLLSFFNFNDSGGVMSGGSANMPGMNKYFSLVVRKEML